jgi:hypothetical protein
MNWKTMSASILIGLGLWGLIIWGVSHALSMTITNDRGGNVSQYWFKAIQAGAQHELVVIDGLCGSACTFYLARACATPRAILMFHAASKPEGTALLWSSYSPQVRQFVGPLTPDIITISGVSAQAMIGACK